MRRSMIRLACLVAAMTALSGCGKGTLDLAGYPDSGRERLYRDGRLGTDKGLASFDLRKTWRAVTGPADHPS